MAFITVYQTAQQNQLMLLRNIFEQNNLRYRILDESSNTNFAIGARVQVHENDMKRAEVLLRDNGFLQEPGPGKSDVSMSQFWLWFVLAMICLVVAAFLINFWMS
ncbi:putative signal transducing protein [Salinimicrobium sediminilitoris]|uniref:putative signal transducing protein n=1 Tax=Salinimicrobium sediminilitoris TaxID=2876715 RepID=UPI001E3AFFC5|nr:DUF2007 domain-containing protein [Salinimicrobium sediminilitoris]MCC8359261.1 DUF2007 domain-containing protein [Salinimicrobium sediminilitoris]